MASRRDLPLRGSRAVPRSITVGLEVLLFLTEDSRQTILHRSERSIDSVP